MKKSPRILLIEDNIHDQYFFSQTILQIDPAIVCQMAHNGKDAIEMLRSLDPLPDIIFIDIHMPMMDGVECLTEIKKLSQVCDIPVIILSSDISKNETLTQMGVKVFIEKPSDYILLQKLLEHVLNMNFETGENVDPEAILSHH